MRDAVWYSSLTRSASVAVFVCFTQPAESGCTTWALLEDRTVRLGIAQGQGWVGGMIAMPGSVGRVYPAPWHGGQDMFCPRGQV